MGDKLRDLSVVLREMCFAVMLHGLTNTYRGMSLAK